MRAPSMAGLNADQMPHAGLHAKKLLDANEERINALYNTLKMLERERRTLCGHLRGNESLTANEINWLFRPPTAPLNEDEYFAEKLGIMHGRC
ncbi:hypothetical protein SIID45300_01329 [Candidatus Magnetaquicoccaceae bacterium FCR-1]|uniref:Uncharacterized protein n=1 Tax=Candidatus Magnetaquiglobus chichijimensis TaxID=3141448 RepID=A0ABQ0C7Z5_9PROT